MVKAFKADKHPEVAKHFRTEKEIFYDFVNFFGKRDPDHEVTLEEFSAFY